MYRTAVVRTGLDVSIRVIPDAVTGTVLEEFHARGRDPRVPRVDAVLFGANGIFLEPEVRAAHTSGHLVIAAAAKQFKVPVYVLSGAVKIQQQPLVPSWRDAVRPPNEWLASRGTGVVKRLEAREAVADWNPREDQIALNLIDAIVTEYGVCTNSEDESRVKKKLRYWQLSIDEFLSQDKEFSESRPEGTQEAIAGDGKPAPVSPVIPQLDSSPHRDGAKGSKVPANRRRARKQA